MASVIKGSVDFYEYVFVNTTGQKKEQEFSKKGFSWREKIIPDPRVDNLGFPVAGSPLRFVLILIAYTSMCIYGPKLMASRKALELNFAMILYNIVQVLANLLYVIWVKS